MVGCSGAHATALCNCTVLQLQLHCAAALHCTGQVHRTALQLQLHCLITRLGIPLLCEREEAGAPLQKVVEDASAALYGDTGGLVGAADALEQRLRGVRAGEGGLRGLG